MPSRPVWTAAAWDDYVYWQTQDRKTLKRIKLLIQDALRDPFTGLGKPEPLRENLAGFWSRRIDDQHRPVYAVEGEKSGDRGVVTTTIERWAASSAGHAEVADNPGTGMLDPGSPYGRPE